LEHLVVTDEDGSDVWIPCIGDDTVGRAGLKPGSELKVVVDDFDDLDDDDESSFR